MPNVRSITEHGLNGAAELKSIRKGCANLGNECRPHVGMVIRSLSRQMMETAPRRVLSNAEIATCLMSLAQLLSMRKENPFKEKAYRRAAKIISTMPESL